MLDPTGCVPLKVDGGSQVTVGTSTIQGVITVDSNATTCSGGSSTISATGSGTLLQAIGPPSGAATGLINVDALPWDATACTIPACDPADVAGGRLAPQPQHGEAASRAYVDWRWNCKSTYPSFHGVTIYGCPNTAAQGGTSYPYIDNLKTAIGTSGTPVDRQLDHHRAGRQRVLAEREHHVSGRQLLRASAPGATTASWSTVVSRSRSRAAMSCSRTT